WAMLLSRYSGEADVVFGVTVSGRDIGLPDIDGMVGLLINTLPLRLRIEDCALFPWLRSVQTQHQLNAQYAYTRLVDIHRCSSMRPGEQLFDSILVLENYPWRVDVPNATSEALRVTDMRAVDRTTFRLTVIVTIGEELHLRVGYDKRRFHEDAIPRVFAHF